MTQNRLSSALDTITLAFTNFAKGVLCPHIRGRVDTTFYYSSALALLGMIVRPYGNPVRAPGTTFHGFVKDSTKDVRLIEFKFSVPESYAIEMGPLYFRFFDNTGAAIGNTYGDVAYFNLGVAKVNGDQVKVTTGGAWTLGGTYTVGKLYTRGGNSYICHNATSAGTAAREPGVGVDWALSWALSNVTTNTVYTILQDHTTSASHLPTDATAAGYFEAIVPNYTLSVVYPLQIAHPYQEHEIWDVWYEQDKDTICLTHPAYEYSELRRYGLKDWRLVTSGLLKGPPWEELNSDKELKIWASSKDVSEPWDLTERTYNATGNVFNPYDVGRYFRLGGWNSEGEQGYFYVDTYVDATQVKGHNVVELKDTAKSTKWSRNAFYWDSNPSFVTFHETRLVLGRIPTDANKFFLSKPYLIRDFNHNNSTGGGGFSVGVNSAEGNDMMWLLSMGDLCCGTFDAEFVSRSPDDAGLNEDNKNAKNQSDYGSERIRPVKSGGLLYYVQRGLRKIREMGFEFTNNKYLSDDVTEFSEHVTASGVKELAVQKNQDRIIHAVLRNGSWAMLSRHKLAEVMAWTTRTTQGLVKSMRFIPDASGFYDRGFMIVQRTLNGVNMKCIESFGNHVIEDDTDIFNDRLYLDCAAQYYPNDSTHYSTLHLYGKTVGLIADGVDLGDFSVNSYGAVVNCPSGYTKYIVGLRYDSYLITNPLNAQTQQGISRGKIHRINKVGIELYRTKGATYGSKLTAQYALKIPEGGQTNGSYGDYTGLIPNLTFPGDNDYKGQIVIKQSSAYPLNILAIYADVDIKD